MTRKKYRTGIMWILLSIGVVSISGGGWAGLAYLKSNFTRNPIAASLLPVEQGDIEITFTEAEMIELGEQKTLKTPRDVIVEQVLVQEGQRISVGQTLLVMRDRKMTIN
jgi:HlyD family secretion protein